MSKGSGFTGGAKANKVLGKTTAPSGNSGGAKANKVLGKPTTPPTTTFVPGKLPKTSNALPKNMPIAGQQRMTGLGKSTPAQKVNADRMKNTLGKMGL